MVWHWRAAVARPEQGVVFDFAVSPSGKLVAVLQQIFEVDVPARDATVKLGNGKLVREWRGGYQPTTRP